MKISDLRLRKIVFEKYNGRCAYCGCKLKSRFCVDHIHPKHKAGINKIENYNPSCFSCNSSKSTLSIEKWREQLVHKVIQLNRDSSTYRAVKRFGLIKETNKDVMFYFERNV